MEQVRVVYSSCDWKASENGSGGPVFQGNLSGSGSGGASWVDR